MVGRSLCASSALGVYFSRAVWHRVEYLTMCVLDPEFRPFPPAFCPESSTALRALEPPKLTRYLAERAKAKRREERHQRKEARKQHKEEKRRRKEEKREAKAALKVLKEMDEEEKRSGAGSQEENGAQAEDRSAIHDSTMLDSHEEQSRTGKLEAIEEEPVELSPAFPPPPIMDSQRTNSSISEISSSTVQGSQEFPAHTTTTTTTTTTTSSTSRPSARAVSENGPSSSQASDDSVQPVEVNGGDDDEEEIVTSKVALRRRRLKSLAESPTIESSQAKLKTAEAVELLKEDAAKANARSVEERFPEALIKEDEDNEDEEILSAEEESDLGDFLVDDTKEDLPAEGKSRADRANGSAANGAQQDAAAEDGENDGDADDDEEDDLTQSMAAYYLPSVKLIEESLAMKREQWVKSGAWQQHEISRKMLKALQSNLYFHSQPIISNGDEYSYAMVMFSLTFAFFIFFVFHLC